MIPQESSHLFFHTSSLGIRWPVYFGTVRPVPVGELAVERRMEIGSGANDAMENAVQKVA